MLTESQRSMRIIASSRPAKKPAKAKGVKREKAAPKNAVKKSVKKVPVKKTTSKKPVVAKPDNAKKRPRAQVLNEHPGNLVADPHDHAANEAIAERSVRRTPPRKPRKLTATDFAAAPPPGETSVTSMVARVSDAIERELSKIEHIVGNPSRLYPAQRIETESRARVLASLARTLKEVMRLREQERGAGDDTTKAADDDGDLGEFRRELSRRLEALVEGRAAISDRGDEPG